MKTVLTIAGSDCSGGAGIQADIKTMIMNGVYAMSAITALTAQNTTGVYGIQETSPEFLDNQLDCIFTDIFPDAVKIGMLSSAEIMHHVAVKLQQYHAHPIFQKLKRSPDCRSQMLTLWKKLLTNFMKAFTFLSF